MARKFKELLSPEERSEIEYRRQGIYHSGNPGRMSARARLGHGIGRIQNAGRKIAAARGSKSGGMALKIARNLSNSDFFRMSPPRKGKRQPGYW